MSTSVNDEAAGELGPRRPNPVDGHVGGRVRLRRMLLGISQEKLGEQLGLTFQQIQKYEKGVNRVSASRLFDLAQVLRVPVQYFFEDLPSADKKDGVVADGFAEPRSESYVVDFLGSREGLELNKAFSRLTNPAHRRAVIELVRSLAGENGTNSNHDAD
jgi:transcriptional regulator with XRE-family HTH domain